MLRHGRCVLTTPEMFATYVSASSIFFVRFVYLLCESINVSPGKDLCKRHKRRIINIQLKCSSFTLLVLTKPVLLFIFYVGCQPPLSALTHRTDETQSPSKMCLVLFFHFVSSRLCWHGAAAPVKIKRLAMLYPF